MLLDLLTNHEKKKKMLFETYPTNFEGWFERYT